MAQPDYAAFLQEQLPLQHALVQQHQWQGQTLWLKKAGPRHGMWRYQLLGAVARISRSALLQPVPNLGGQAAIATEVRRLQDLAAAGIRVPEVLAVQADGFLMRNLGQHHLLHELHSAAHSPGRTGLLPLWQEGLDFLSRVHTQGQCLSQAFSRNIVRCDDGELGAIDFEDDPSASLPLALCQARDALAFVHSSALFLQEDLPQAQALWRQWLAGQNAAMQAELHTAIAQLRFLRFLPSSSRFGRDTQRLRYAHDLLAG